MIADSRYEYKFIGRKDALDQFHSLRSLREQKNTLYVEAAGGLGKTRLLQRFIESCRKQRRPWHVGKEKAEIIDFYHLDNRTIDGVRRSIAQRVGVDYFERFFKIENEIVKLRNLEETAAQYQAIALERELEIVFFQELKQALPKIRNYVVLFFDTFEVVYNRSVGLWFLDVFLPHEATAGYLIVFAGRPCQFTPPVNVYSFSLKPFTDFEVQDYFREKKGTSFGDPEKIAAQVTKGHPLLLDLVTHYTSILHGAILDWKNYSENEIEEIIVREFLNADDPLHQMVHEMAYLKRRYDREIYEHLHGDDPDFPDYITAKDEILKWPFVKERQEDDSIALHDVFQEMIESHGRGNWNKTCSDLYENIVRNWYKIAIDRAGVGLKRDLLSAEQIAYIIDENLTDGIRLYEERFQEIQESKQFAFNDMLWGEVAALLYEKIQPKSGVAADKKLLTRAYELTRAQANWLFGNSHPDSAAFWFRKTVQDPMFDNARDAQCLSDDINSLGHCYLSMGRTRETEKLWVSAYEEAQKAGNRREKAEFAYNLAHVRTRQGRWEDALQLYEVAAVTSREVSNSSDLLGEILFVMARLRGRQGQISLAIQEIQHSLRLIELVRNGHIRQAQAFIFAGDIYRYNGDIEQAREYYEKADQLIKKLGGWYEWQAQASASLGAIYNESGSQKRKNWKDVDGDLADQKKAFDYFIECLNSLQKYAIYTRLPIALDRLADLYIEVSELEKISPVPERNNQLTVLIDKMGQLTLPEEQLWRDRLRDSSIPFSALDNLGRAQRLFELAFWISDQIGEPHYMFDSLVRAASIAQKRGRPGDLEYYAIQANVLRGIDDPRQESLFFTLLDLLKAHVSFDQNPAAAVQEYSRVGMELAKSGNFGLFILRQQYEEMQKHLLSIPKADSQSYCETLGASWEEIPELKTFIQSVQDNLDASE